MKVASKIELQVQIKNGRFASNLPLIKSVLEAYEGFTIDVIFKKRRNKRSNPQNKYYWGVIVPIFQNAIKEQWGEIWAIKDVHEFLKANCNFTELVNEDTGEILRKTKSTSENSTSDQEQFHEKCRKLCYEFLGAEIPLPNEDLKLEF